MLAVVLYIVLLSISLFFYNIYNLIFLFEFMSTSSQNNKIFLDWYRNENIIEYSTLPPWFINEMWNWDGIFYLYYRINFII